MLSKVCGQACSQALQTFKRSALVVHHQQRVLLPLGVQGRLYSDKKKGSNDHFTGPSVSLRDSAGAQPVTVEGFQGNIHEFSAGRAQAIVDRAVEDLDLSKEEKRDRVQQGIQGGEEAYSHTGNVSLHGVMEDGVPSPPAHSPNHRNMPNHGGVLQDKVYVSGQRQDQHPSKKYSTYSDSGPQGAQDLRGTTQDNKSSDSQTQGVQGSPKQQLSSQFSGHSDSLGQQGAQDMRGTSQQTRMSADGQLQGIQGSAVAQLANKENPCPQGVQGHDCDRFKVWLNNCVKHGFINCDEQLQGIQSGRKTLSQIFDEQDALIRKAASGQRHYSTSSSPSDPKWA